MSVKSDPCHTFLIIALLYSISYHAGPLYTGASLYMKIIKRIKLTTYSSLKPSLRFSMSSMYAGNSSTWIGLPSSDWFPYMCSSGDDGTELDSLTAALVVSSTFSPSLGFGETTGLLILFSFLAPPPLGLSALTLPFAAFLPASTLEFA